MYQKCEGRTKMQKHIALTGGGLITGILAIFYFKPLTSPGATLLVILSLLVVYIAGITSTAAVRLLRSQPSASQSRSKPNLSLIFIPLMSLLALNPANLRAQPGATGATAPHVPGLEALQPLTQPLDFYANLQRALEAIRAQRSIEAHNFVDLALQRITKISDLALCFH